MMARTATKPSSHTGNVGKTFPSLDSTTTKDLGLDTQMAELRAISARWWGRGTKLWLLTGSLAVLGAITMGVASFLAPSGSLGSDLDIPAEIISALPSGLASLGLTISSSVDRMFSAAMKVMLPLGGLLLLIAPLRWAFSDGETESLFLPAVIGTGMISLAVLLGPELGLGGADTTKNQTHRLVSWIESSNVANTPAGLYVIAQAALSEDSERGKDIDLFKATSSALLSPSLSFEASPRVLFYIEKSAYGHAKSPAAVEYVNSRMRRTKTAESTAKAFGYAAAATSFIAVTFSLLGWLVNRRWRRLRQAIILLRKRTSRSPGPTAV